MSATYRDDITTDCDEVDGYAFTPLQNFNDPGDLQIDAAPQPLTFRGCKPDSPELYKSKCVQEKDVFDSGIASYDSRSINRFTIEQCSSGGLSAILGKLSVEDRETREQNLKENSVRSQSEKASNVLDVKHTVDLVHNDRVLFDDITEIFEQDSDGDTQLHNAVIQLLMPIAMFFINKVPSADYLNIPNNLLQTPLHLAVITRMTTVVRRLIVAGADITAPDHKGDTPLHIACREGLEDIATVLLEPVTYNETLENQYKIPYQKIPQNLEIRNYNGQTCLHVAAEGTHLSVMRLLLKNGCDINAQDGKSGRTVLHYASESGNRILLEFLLQFYYIELECKTYGGLTPMLLAQGRGFKYVIQRLMQSGAKFQSLSVEESDSDDDMDEGFDDLCLGGTPITSYR